MTVKEFKEKYPQYKNLEGDDLWNLMENILLQEQNKRKKSYQLRWLFYRKKRNLVIGKNNYTASEICSNCKKGVSNWMSIWYTDSNSESHNKSYCPHCNADLIREKNNSLLYKLHTKKEVFWNILDKIHICKNSTGGRYDMFNDEHYFVTSTEFTKDWMFKKNNFRKRKWWEYIIIEK